MPRKRTGLRWAMYGVYGLSAILIGSTVAVWNHFRSHYWWWRSGSGRHSIVLAESSFFFVSGPSLLENPPAEFAKPRGPGFHYMGMSSWAAPADAGVHEGTVSPEVTFGSFDLAHEGGDYTIRIPFWGFCAIAASPTLVPLWLLLRGRSRTRAGCCRFCGYDRRGLPAEAKCPECGTVPARG
jgi:hypothetical protein